MPARLLWRPDSRLQASRQPIQANQPAALDYNGALRGPIPSGQKSGCKVALPMIDHFKALVFQPLSRNPLFHLLLIFGCWRLGGRLSAAIPFYLPGIVYGFALLLMLLFVLNVGTLHLEKPAGWILSDMALFFIPAEMAVLEHPEFLGATGLKIAATILVSTALVMLSTLGLVNLLIRRLHK